MAIAMIGTPLALSLGVPLGTLMGGVLGWRSIFGIMSGMAVVLVAWVLLVVPDYPGQKSGERLSIRQVFVTPGVRPILFVIVAWMLAHNILYTYIAPFLAPSGQRAHAIHEQHQVDARTQAGRRQERRDVGIQNVMRCLLYTSDAADE